MYILSVTLVVPIVHIRNFYYSFTKSDDKGESFVCRIMNIMVNQPVITTPSLGSAVNSSLIKCI